MTGAWDIGQDSISHFRNRRALGIMSDLRSGLARSNLVVGSLDYGQVRWTAPTALHAIYGAVACAYS